MFNIVDGVMLLDGYVINFQNVIAVKWVNSTPDEDRGYIQFSLSLNVAYSIDECIFVCIDSDKNSYSTTGKLSSKDGNPIFGILEIQEDHPDFERIISLFSLTPKE